MLRFDAYSATTLAAKPDDLLQIVADSVPILSPGFSMTQGKGFHTFAERLSIKGPDGSEFASIQWGGRQGDRCMIEVKGEHSPAVVNRLRERFSHRCTRVDSCADFDAPKAFERLYRGCKAVKKAHRIVGGKMGDWEDFPEKGRTLYLGSTQSVTRARLYEKGSQPQYAHLNRPNWARLEVQVRPAKDAKFEYSKLSPVEVWGASAWSRDLAASLLQSHVDPHPAGSTYRLTERDAALRWMCKQYGNHLSELAIELGGWDCVGLTLNEIIKEGRKK